MARKTVAEIEDQFALVAFSTNEKRTILLPAVLEDIKHAKTQQWVIGSGLAAFYGLIIGYQFSSTIERVAGLITAIIAYCIAVFAIARFEDDLREYRIRKDIILYGQPKQENAYNSELVVYALLMGIASLVFTVTTIIF